MDYSASFIQSVSEVDPRKRYPASYFRRDLVLNKKVACAKLIVTACGLYQAYVNGQLVDQQPFMPGCTYYHERLQYQTYDITDMLAEKKNTLAAVLGDGWYRGEIGAASKRNVYGTITKFMAALEIQYADGSEEVMTTDEQWKTTQAGPVRFNDLKAGEDYDATLEMAGWNAPDYDDSHWQKVFAAEYSGHLIPAEGEKILEHEALKPEVLVTPDGSTVLDFKQNIFGYVAFTVTGPKDHKVTLIHGETLDEHKNFTQKNLFMRKKAEKKRFQVLNYVLKQGSQSYKPIFSAYGFQYIKLENWPEDVKAENFRAYAVYSDMKQTGSFECSNPLVNQLVRNTIWSQKGNFMDIPTDCPTRERAGWTGDIAAFCETGTYLMDISRFLAKWLGDLKAQQFKSGCVQNIVPDVGLNIGHGSAGWADACIIVPYVLYQVYGNEQVLQDQYESMSKWMQFVRQRAKKHSVFSLLKKNPYKAHTIDTGWHFGEWLEPGHSMITDSLKAFIVADTEVATAYYACSARLMSEIARILGKDEDADAYAETARNATEAYRYLFVKNGVVKSDRQARFVRPVALDLMTADEKKDNMRRLNQMVIDHQYRIGTGFLTTQYILDVLTEYGYTETAYAMIENTGKPGWLYNVTKGATTIWEDWEGISDEGVPKNSFNHYAFGTVVKWLFKYSAGISALEPGYKKVRICPKPGGSFSYVRCFFDSPSGMIKVSWEISEKRFELNVTLPVSGEVHLPDGEVHLVSAGSYTYHGSLGHDA